MSSLCVFFYFDKQFWILLATNVNHEFSRNNVYQNIDLTIIKL